MAADAELTRLLAEKAAIQKSIAQIEADNTVQGSFGDVNIRRNEIQGTERPARPDQRPDPATQGPAPATCAIRSGAA